MRLPKVLFCIFLAFLFFACKKKTKEVIVEETVPAEYSLFFSANLNFIKNGSSGYDTTISANGGVSKLYKVSQKSFSYTKATITCNNNGVFTFINPPNKLAYFSPSCLWKVSDSLLGELFYNDERAFPSFSDQNWLDIDSINGQEIFTLDFNTFDNYDIGVVQFDIRERDWSSNRYFNYSAEQKVLTFEKGFFAGIKGICKIDIYFSNIISTKLNGYSSSFSKGLNFTIYTKVY